MQKHRRPPEVWTESVHPVKLLGRDCYLQRNTVYGVPRPGALHLRFYASHLYGCDGWCENTHRLSVNFRRNFLLALTDGLCPPGGKWLLGDRFLANRYVIYDYDHARVGFSGLVQAPPTWLERHW